MLEESVVEECWGEVLEKSVGEDECWRRLLDKSGGEECCREVL